MTDRPLAAPAAPLPDAHAGVNEVPCIEAVAPGVEAVVVPSGLSTWLSEGLPVRAYVVDGGGPDGWGPVALVDAGYASRLSVESISTAIAARRLETILLTHRHPDHDGGARALALRHGARVRAAAAEAASFGADAALAPEPVVDGEVVEVGELRLTALATPGHSKGHLAYHDQRRGWLFAGDAVLGEGTVLVGPPDGSVPRYLASLERLLALEPLTLLFPGHGPPVSEPKAKIAALIRHRRMRREQILGVLRAGPQTAEGLVALLYAADTPGHLHGLARLSVEGTLAWLEEDGVAVREGDAFRVP